MTTGLGVARIGDTVTGFCRGPNHVIDRPFTGHWTQGSTTVTADGIGVIRVNDIGITDCGHQFHAITGSGVGVANGLAVHRVGDLVETVGGGTGSTVSGSGVVTSL